MKYIRRSFFVLFCGVFLAYAIALCSIMFFSLATPVQKTPCIVVFGSAIDTEQNPGPILRDRMQTAIALAQQWHSTCLILSGGPALHATGHEVTVMDRMAREAGIDISTIYTDYSGLTTKTTIRNLDPTLPVTYVSSGFHMARIALLSYREGHPIFTLAPAKSFYKQTPFLLMRESTAIIFYALHLDYVIKKRPVSAGGL